MTTYNEFSLPRVSAGVSGQAAVNMLNAPIAAAENALNTLAARLAGMSNKSAIVRKNVPMSSAVYVGALVYFNADPAAMRCEPALAKLAGTPGAQGQSVEEPCSRVIGLVLSIDSQPDGADNVVGTLLEGGYWEDVNVVSGCLGANPTPGTYYLSPATAGAATNDPGSHLRQPILTYHGSNRITLGLFYMAHDNHFHGSCVLTGTWNDAANPPDELEAPSGAVWWYDPSTDANMVDIGELSPETTAVFEEGILQGPASDYVVYGGYLWCKAASAPESGTVTLFNHYPFAYGSPVVRSVESTNDALTIRMTNGIVFITQHDFAQSQGQNSPQAVANIVGKQMTMTPVVPEIIQGPGVNITRRNDGACILSSALQVDTPIDAYSVNYNGANLSSDGTFLYFTFPKGRASSVVMSMPVTGIPADLNMKAFAWGCAAGTGAVFSVNAYWLPLPSSDTPVAMPAQAVSLGNLSLTGSAGNLTYGETATAIPFTGNGQLVAEVTVSGVPADDVRLTRIGFKLEINTGD